jgi:ABC-2 type transport system ATP-binding protein
MDPVKVQSRLELVSGVTRVHLKNNRDNRSVFEVESRKGLVRGDVARAVVEAGWDLNELRPAAVSLEEIFLQLTGAPAAAPAEEAVPAGVK